MSELLINGALRAAAAQPTRGEVRGAGLTQILPGWQLYNDDPATQTAWQLNDSLGPDGALAWLKVTTSRSGTRIAQQLRAAPPLGVRVTGWALVSSGILLAGAGHGAATLGTVQLDGAGSWRHFDFTVPAPVDQLVFYTTAGATFGLAGLSAQPVPQAEPPAPERPGAQAALTPAVGPGPAGQVADAAAHGPGATKAANTSTKDAVEMTSTPTANQTPAADPTPSPPPLAAFDTAGTASVISYQVPEPTSYTGKHVLTLDYSLSYFADVITSQPQTATANAARATTSEPAAAEPSGTTTAPPPPLTDSIVLPRAVVASDSGTPASAVIALAPFDLSDRLTALTWADVANIAAAGKRLDVYRSIGGQLDYRIRNADTTGITPAGPVSAARSLLSTSAQPNLRPALLPVTVPPGGGPPPSRPFLEVLIDSPSPANPALAGPWNGLQLPITGRALSFEAGTPTVTVVLVNASGTPVATTPATLSGQNWQASLPVTASGRYTLTATGAASASGVRFINATVTVTVDLAAPPASPPPTPPAIVPSVTVSSPTANMVITDADGNAVVPISGTANTNGGTAVTVGVSIDGGNASTVTLAPATGGTASPFTTTAVALGYGTHTLTVSAANADGVSAPTWTIPFSVLASQPIVALDRRLVLIEKIAITSFLGDFGASRVVKTFSLLPGEQTTISVETYTKTESTAKTASSILDSTASECSADFEDTVNDENDSKASTQDATNKSISADVGASWGWGHADIKAGYTDQANASRENTVKTVQNALQKHTSKASSNRTMSVNTDFSTTDSSGTTTDTSRTLKNINVSRVLNFVFRQLTQQHQVIISLTDVTVGYYTQDELVDAVGNPLTGPDGGPLTRETFTEYTLPELTQFAQSYMKDTAVSGLPSDVLTVLGSVPDYQGSQQTLVEWVTPTGADGTPQPDAQYLRVKPNLTGTYTVPGVGTTFTVPGIVLGASSYVMRTDQLLCDALLGQGDALDAYSHALQDVAIAERQTAVAAAAAATAREQLAQQIVTNKDTDAATVWQKIYPQPLSVPATITIPAVAPPNTPSPDDSESTTTG